MKTFHPEFDGRQWLVKIGNDDLVVANTICQLIPKLREQFPRAQIRIKDYYPIGKSMPKPVWPKDVKVVPTKVLAAIKKSPLINPPAPKMPPKVFKYDHDQILNLWELGWSAIQIAEYLRYDKSKAISQIVCNARALGDPRAKPRLKDRAGWHDGRKPPKDIPDPSTRGPLAID